ncbi:uncharacterized protein BJ212DRAFT_1482111 [Suillus subaureus]|uniref:Uncharacterized protein n=1 Tax=Suillus subaureus TaxID=48587 RepID=A0A9P7E8I7_9AGAM|nr:uncharacterized protein BJ212DRAFT_1482111 [Suillus subaureus]KAG1814374.1 hypothetical protein BJ212DRAFT_1482111 [Suillus subaureus]
MVASLGFHRLVSIIPYISTILAVQVHSVKRSIVSPATCTSEYSWMDDGQGDSPCLTVAYVEAACSGNNSIPDEWLFVLLAKFFDRKSMLLCSSWSSYNLMMACTICQGSNDSAIWEWAEWASGCTTNSSWTEKYFPSGYVLAGNASIPYWATTDPTTWTSATFNIMDANATYQRNSSSITRAPYLGGTIGTLAALSLFAVGAYLVYRRHVYKKGAYASVVNQQPFIDRGDGAATRMTHNRFPSDSSDFSQSFGSPVLYGQSLSPSQYGTVYSPQPQMAYPSLQADSPPTLYQWFK